MSTTSFQGFEAVASRFPNVAIRGTAARSWCPVHQADGRSSRQNRSLMMRQTENGSIQIVCNAGCQHRAILEAVGLRFVDLLPDGLRHSKAPHVKPKFEGWPCLQTLDALMLEINVVRIAANQMIEGHALTPDDHKALRRAHHVLTDAAQRVSREVRHG